METPSRKLLLTVLAAGVSVAITAHTTRTVRNEQRAKRKEIEEEVNLNLQAILNAQAVVQSKIESGVIRNLEQLADSVDSEIKFQKIAIRESP